MDKTVLNKQSEVKMNKFDPEYRNETAKIFKQNISEKIALLEANDNPENLSSEELTQVQEYIQYKGGVDNVEAQIKDQPLCDWQHEQSHHYSDLINEEEEKTTKIALEIIKESFENIIED